MLGWNRTVQEPIGAKTLCRPVQYICSPYTKNPRRKYVGRPLRALQKLITIDKVMMIIQVHDIIRTATCVSVLGGDFPAILATIRQ